MVVRDETGASAHTLHLLDRLREYVELAARLRSAAPLQLVAHALRAPELSVTSFVAQHQLDEKLQRALLQAGVNPRDPLPADAHQRIAASLLSLAQQAETPMAPMRVAPVAGVEASSAARAQAEARVAAAEQAAAAANAELQLVRGALQRQTAALDGQQRTLDHQREGLQAAHGLQAECEQLKLQLAAASGGGGSGGEATAAAATAAAAAVASRRELEGGMQRRCSELEAELRAVEGEREELQLRLGRLEPLLLRLEATS